MATEMPWFPMYPADFLVSTATMTPTQGWAYTQLLMYAWTNGGIPDDREQCAVLTRCQLSDSDWAIVRKRFEVMATPMATPMATLCNPRMERERVRARERHESASEAGRRGANARWHAANGVANGNPNGNPNGEANGNPNGKTMAVTTTTTTTSNPLPPSRPVAPPVKDKGGVVSNWKPDPAMVDRVAKSNPTVATRLERAQAGDLFIKDASGTRVAVTPDQVLSEARKVVTEQIVRERTVIVERLTAKGLTPAEAQATWFRWWQEHCNGGAQPTVALRNDLADTTVRNHAAVWRARLSAQPA